MAGIEGRDQRISIHFQTLVPGRWITGHVAREPMRRRGIRSHRPFAHVPLSGPPGQARASNAFLDRPFHSEEVLKGIYKCECCVVKVKNPVQKSTAWNDGPPLLVRLMNREGTIPFSSRSTSEAPGRILPELGGLCPILFHGRAVLVPPRDNDNGYLSDAEAVATTRMLSVNSLTRMLPV